MRTLSSRALGTYRRTAWSTPGSGSSTKPMVNRFSTIFSGKTRCRSMKGTGINRSTSVITGAVSSYSGRLTLFDREANRRAMPPAITHPNAGICRNKLLKTLRSKRNTTTRLWATVVAVRGLSNNRPISPKLLVGPISVRSTRASPLPR